MKKYLIETVAVCLLLTALVTTALAGIGTVSIGPSETQILPANADRKWVTLQNNSTNDIYVKYDSTTNALTTSNGIKIPANGGTLSIAATGYANPSRNAIKAVSATGTNSLTYQEGNEN